MKLNEERSKRLKFLADNLSFDYENDKNNSVLLNTVDNAIKEVFEYLKKVLEDAYATDPKGKGAALFLEILQRDIDSLDDEESKNLIVSSLSKPFSYYESGAFLNLLNELAVRSTVSYRLKAVKIESDVISDIDTLNEYCRIISNFVPPFFPCTASGNGVKFSVWDGLTASWYQLDKMNMPFYFMDTLYVEE